MDRAARARQRGQQVIPLRSLALLACGLLLPLAGCIPSNVLAPDQRIATVAMEDRVFTPTTDVQLDGFYESVEITGDAAVSLRKVYYLFQQGGTYTAAALVQDQGASSFQTLTGTWSLDASGLRLDDTDPVPLETSGEFVRMKGTGGTLVLRRGVID